MTFGEDIREWEKPILNHPKNFKVLKQFGCVSGAMVGCPFPALIVVAEDRTGHYVNEFGNNDPHKQVNFYRLRKKASGKISGELLPKITEPTVFHYPLSTPTVQIVFEILKGKGKFMAKPEEKK